MAGGLAACTRRPVASAPGFLGNPGAASAKPRVATRDSWSERRPAADDHQGRIETPRACPNAIQSRWPDSRNYRKTLTSMSSYWCTATFRNPTMPHKAEASEPPITPARSSRTNASAVL